MAAKLGAERQRFSPSTTMVTCSRASYPNYHLVIRLSVERFFYFANGGINMAVVSCKMAI
jgi:hypothetical protein